VACLGLTYRDSANASRGCGSPRAIGIEKPHCHFVLKPAPLSQEGKPWHCVRISLTYSTVSLQCCSASTYRPHASEVLGCEEVNLLSPLVHSNCLAIAIQSFGNRIHTATISGRSTSNTRSHSLKILEGVGAMGATVLQVSSAYARAVRFAEGT
jgi:hypothetical protein